MLASRSSPLGAEALGWSGTSTFGVGEFPSYISSAGICSTSMGSRDEVRLLSDLVFEIVEVVLFWCVAEIRSGWGLHVVWRAKRSSCLRVLMHWAFSALRSILKAEISRLVLAWASTSWRSLSARIA
jgi:hypothetical protein